MNANAETNYSIVFTSEPLEFNVERTSQIWLARQTNVDLHVSAIGE